MNLTNTSRLRGTSLYQDQLRIGFSLRFGDFLEGEFREEYSRENHQKARLVLGLCAMVMIVITFMELFSPDASGFMVGAFALFLMVPLLLATLTFSYLKQPMMYQVLLAVSALAVGIAGTVVDVQASLDGKGYYFAGQIGWIFIVWSMLGLMFGAAVALCALVSSLYMAFAIYAGLPLEQLFFEGFMLLAVNLLGGYSCYKIEHSARRHFLESRMLNQLAERDGLTGLYNRRAFDHYMERIWRQSRRENTPFTLMLIDIDHFKPFNDHYGHQAGDDALKQVASVISSAVQRPLDMAARYGGEEFALVLYGPATDYVMNLPELLREDVLELRTTHEAATMTKLLTVSIGVAVVTPDSKRSLAGAIQLADEALYQAKEAGRNRVVVRFSGNAALETGRFRARATA